MPFIKNSFTKEVTKDRIGTKDELKYFRVSGGPDVDRLNPEKRFYANKAEYYLHTCFNRWSGNIEQYETAIRSNLSLVEDLMPKLMKLSVNQGYETLLKAISNDPIVSFGVVPDYEIHQDVQDISTERWVQPGRNGRIVF
tara:strand:+ start:427 stop:846 length:420 start_codon:yes stop_codon:yes gene_type:complete